MSKPLNVRQFAALASIVKASQDITLPPALPRTYNFQRKPKHDPLAGSFPAYDKSLLVQLSQDPQAAGRNRALGAGAISAIIAALITRVAAGKYAKNPYVVGGAALGGGIAGAIPGYISGKREAESERSRLLFLRRLGVSRAGELETLMRYPELSGKVTREGTII
jgi:hypothetical protein